MYNKPLKSFKDLKVWQKSVDLATLVYSATEKFPKSELYGITNQMRRAVISHSSNIAEGFKRVHKKEKLQFYNIAYGSTAELESQIEIAYKLGFLIQEDYEKLTSLNAEISKMIDGLMKSLNSKSYILNPQKKGYIAITTVLILSLVMLLLALSIGSITFFARYNTVDFDNKRASHYAAFSCLEYTRLMLAENAGYGGNATTTVGSYQCYVFPIETSGSNKIIKSRSSVGGATTNLKLTVTASGLSTVSFEEVVKF